MGTRTLSGNRRKTPADPKWSSHAGAKSSPDTKTTELLQLVSIAVLLSSPWHALIALRFVFPVYIDAHSTND
jgi:hypothetical protein